MPEVVALKKRSFPANGANDRRRRGKSSPLKGGVGRLIRDHGDGEDGCVIY